MAKDDCGLAEEHGDISGRPTQISTVALWEENRIILSCLWLLVFLPRFVIGV